MASTPPDNRTTPPDYRQTPPPPAGGGMVGRIQRIILRPKEEWVRIEAEPASAEQTFKRWAVPLAAIPPLAQLIGGQLFGYGAFGFHYRPSLGGALVTAVIGYAMALVGVWLIALIINWLAPNFGATPNRDQAMKVAAYSYTAAWVAGILNLIPSLAILGALLGLYSLYLLWLGLPRLMRAPEDKATTYTAATIAVAVVVSLIATAITGALVGAVAAPASYATASTASGTVTVPGMGTVDLGKLDAASKQMEAQANGSRAAVTVAPDRLQALLPAAIGNWQRTAIESQSGAAAGVGAAGATGTYKSGNDQIEVSVADLGAMGALAGLGGALNVNSSKETANGYEKTSTVNGRMVTEEWDAGRRHGSYTTIINNRFSVSAEGTAPDAATFKAAVEAIPLDRLGAMAG